MSFTWTDPTITSQSTVVKKTHFDELKNNYKSVEGAVSFSPAYSVTINQNPTFPAAVTITDLRTAINTLESKFSNNCNCYTNPDCCQSCQACQTCQTYSCQSNTCQTCQAQCDCNCSDCNCDSH